MAFTRTGVVSHDNLSDVGATDHHTATVAADLNLADLNARAHGDLSDAPADAHHNEAHTAVSHSDQGATGAELETLTDTSNADTLHAHAHAAVTGKGTDDHHNEAHTAASHSTRDTRMATGSYTGDGAESQGITGVGFQVVTMMLAVRVTAAGGMSNRGWLHTWDTLIDNHANGLSISWVGAEVYQYIQDAVISLDADGFTVDDAAADTHPNMNGVVYDFVCWG